MPVVNRKSRWGIVNNCLCVVVDAPSVVPVLVVKTLPHRQMLGKPFSQVPLAHDGSKVTGFLKSFCDGALICVQSMNPSCWFPVGMIGELQTQFGKVAGFPKSSERQSLRSGKLLACQKCRSRRSTNAMGVKLGQTHPIVGELVDVGSQCRIATVEPRLVPSHVVCEDENNVGTLRSSRWRTNQTCGDQQGTDLEKRGVVVHVVDGFFRSNQCSQCSQRSQPTLTAVAQRVSGASVNILSFFSSDRHALWQRYS